MRLKHLTISNCSRVSDIDIDIRDNLVLIGPNGSGKSTVLLCLDMMLGMSDQQLHDTLSTSFIRDETQPLTIEATLADLNDDERVAFRDETDAANGCEVKLRLDVHDRNGEIDISRSFSNPGNRTSPTEAQKSAFGWTILQAQTGFIGTQDALGISSIPSEREPPDVAKKDLSDWISQALPFDIGKGDLEFASRTTESGGLMGDMRLRVHKDGRMLPVRELSDGTRTLITMATCGQLHQGTNILAIDEPEAHLHPSSQRSLAKTLKASGCQKILVTHSPTIAGSFEPDEIVVIRPDGSAAQPKRGFLSGDDGMLARWWIGKQLEPLTAGSVIAVEGPSDRIIVNKVASTFGFDLDRHDVVLVETNGCGDMKVIESIFGSGGFDIPLYELIDQDAADEAARRLDVAESDLETHDVFVSTSDLEDEYVQAIGAKKLWDAFKSSRTFSPHTLAVCETGPDGYPTEVDLAQFIREKSKRKIPAALVAAKLIDDSNAANVKSVAALLQAVSP